MEESKKTIIDRQTLIPIGLVISIIAVVWGASALNSKAKNNSERIDKVEIRVDQSPTRNEFNALKDTMNEIKKDVKLLLQAK